MLGRLLSDLLRQLTAGKRTSPRPEAQVPGENPLAEYFFNNPGRLIHKWHHYFDIYHRHFARFRGRSPVVVEMGVFHGGSLQMWHHYFGPGTRVVGIDIDPRCRSFEDEATTILIGDQGDRRFLAEVRRAVPDVDILIDDGGHKMAQQITTFEELYPHVQPNGIYVKLKEHKIPVSIKEWLTLLEAMQKDVISPSIDEFYYLSRTALVKDEQNFDKFDRAFGEYFKGIESIAGVEFDVPLEWLLKQAELNLSPEEKAMIEALGGWEKLMEALKKRLEEQKGRHQGGNKWIGTAGTSPFGAYGYNPEGVRIGQDGSRNRSAVKVWDRREYRNLDDSVELGTRNIKVALRRLRKFAREGAPEELDLDTTIDRTARNAGYLDLAMRPERHNAVKVLMFLDIGGTMDDHIRLCEELFSAAKTEFKHLEYFYFHNCLYDHVWKDNLRRRSERTRTSDVMHKYGRDYKLVFVGDATMSPYEILQPGGSIEYSNDEAGAAWLKRMLEAYPRAAWLNPQPEEIWPYRQSIGIIREIMGGRMYPTTIAGLERAMRALAK